VRLVKTLASVAIAIGVAASPAQAKETVVELDWDKTTPLSGEVVDGEVGIVSTSGGGAFPLAVIEDPSVGGTGYALEGEVRYDGVQGTGFLEMWSVFPDGSRYFSRTLDSEGPMAAITGDSGPREFWLPFYLEGAAPPSSLEVGLILPGSGTVRVGPMRLVSLDGEGGWWSDRTGGLVGGIGGGLIGVFGAVVGGLVSRRKARGFVLGSMRVLAAFGVLLLAVGALALATSQPYAVYFPLLLGGVILVGVFGSGYRTARRAYEDAELRRMRALDSART
jgi:hypothetical protein